MLSIGICWIPIYRTVWMIYKMMISFTILTVGFEESAQWQHVDAVFGALGSITEIDDQPAVEPGEAVDGPQSGKVLGSERRLRLGLDGDGALPRLDQEIDLDLALGRRPIPEAVEGMAGATRGLAIRAEQLADPALEKRTPLGGRGWMKLSPDCAHDATVGPMELRMASFLHPQLRLECRQ